jgi:uncharacterized protein involved in exopolysaccharide biosynthesis
LLENRFPLFRTIALIRTSARELEREAESDRAVCAAFLNCAKQVGEQEGVSDANLRIITRAVPPDRHAFTAGSCFMGMSAVSVSRCFAISSIR